MSTQNNETWLELTSDDGHRLDVFEVAPAARTEPRGTVVVLQEIFGVNPHIQHMSRRLADAGYTAAAPALFDRRQKNVSLAYDAAGIARGKELIAGIEMETALRDVAAAVARYQKSGPVAVLGFCWGGSLAWLAAARLPVAGAVAYYGGQIGAFIDSAPRRPMLTHFGANDASIPPSVPAEVGQRYGMVTNHVYPAGHGFNCDERATFDAACAATAWRRSLGFFAAVM